MPKRANTWPNANRKKKEREKTQEERKELESLISLSYLLPRKILIEEEAPALIKNLQRKGVHVIGMTHFPVGEIGLISDVASWRVKLLKEFDISFSFLGIDRFSVEIESSRKSSLVLYSVVKL